MYNHKLIIKIGTSINGGFLSHGGTPSHYKPSGYWGTPVLGNLQTLGCVSRVSLSWIQRHHKPQGDRTGCTKSIGGHADFTKKMGKNIYIIHIVSLTTVNNYITWFLINH